MEMEKTVFYISWFDDTGMALWTDVIINALTSFSNALKYSGRKFSQKEMLIYLSFYQSKVSVEAFYATCGNVSSQRCT